MYYYIYCFIIITSVCFIHFSRSSGVTPALLAAFTASGQLFVRGTTRSSYAEGKTKIKSNIWRTTAHVEFSFFVCSLYLFYRVSEPCWLRCVALCLLYGPSGEHRLRVRAAAAAQRRLPGSRPGAAGSSPSCPGRSSRPGPGASAGTSSASAAGPPPRISTPASVCETCGVQPHQTADQS